MTRMLAIVFATLLITSLLVPVGADALPKGAVGFKLYHQEGSEWARYLQSDPFPPGGATSPTNVWKYEYEVMNYQVTTGIYQLMIYFNSDNVLWATYTSALAPTGWLITYFGPTAPNYNWKVRFRTANSLYYVPLNDTLPGYVVQFTWARPDTLPGPQNYDLLATGTSESGVTYEVPPEQTPVDEDTWGRIKSLFLR